MKRKMIFPALFIAVAAGVFLWWKWRPSEEKRVQQQVERLAARFSRQSDEGGAAMALKMNGLSNMFADTFSVNLTDFPFNGEYSSSTMLSNIARARALFEEITLRFYDVSVELTDEDAAEVLFTARVVMKRKAGGAAMADTREMRCALKRVDGKWLFVSFSEQQVLVP
ncbi:MAG: hypothetical protein KAI66_13900 [Lentisphaeria bacterium]|nr:hypothetical protein [Lentisphaeria bacterium]